MVLTKLKSQKCIGKIKDEKLDEKTWTEIKESTS